MSCHARRQTKTAVRDFLERRDIDGIGSLSERDPRVLRVLLSLTNETVDRIRWRAIQAIGAVAAVKARSNPESVRDLLRRFLWSMNDESGNVAWHAPEAIGEILACVPELIGEFRAILFSYLREEPFERGSHWALARISWIRPEDLVENQSKLHRSLEDGDPFNRAHAAISLCTTGKGNVEEEIRNLSGDDSSFRIYDYRSGKMEDLTVSRVAEAVLGHTAGSIERPAYLYSVLGRIREG